MLYVILSDGTLEELPDATQTIAVDGSLACTDSEGRVVKEYKRHSVLTFGHDERVRDLAEKLREES